MISIREAHLLRGVDPTEYVPGTLTIPEYTGVYGLYSPDSGRFVRTSRFDVFASIAVGSCTGVMFGDGEEDFVQGTLAVDTGSFLDLINDRSHMAELSGHVNHQVGAVPDAMFSGTIRMSEASAHLASLVNTALRELSA